MSETADLFMRGRKLKRNRSLQHRLQNNNREDSLMAKYLN